MAYFSHQKEHPTIKWNENLNKSINIFYIKQMDINQD